MIERVEFPEYLDSYKGNSPSDMEELKFQNYYPRSEKLKKTAQIIPINDDCQILQKSIVEEMKSLTLDTLYEDGKINILPKKTTLDLRRNLSKKMVKLDKKTEKAIAVIAKDLLMKKRQNLNSN